MSIMVLALVRHSLVNARTVTLTGISSTSADLNLNHLAVEAVVPVVRLPNAVDNMEDAPAAAILPLLNPLVMRLEE